MLSRDLLGALITVLFGAAVFVMSRSFDPAAALFPRAVAGIMILCGVILGGRALLRGQKSIPDEVDPAALPRTGLIILLTILYVIGVSTIGYMTATVIFIPLTAWLLGIRQVAAIALATVIFVGLTVFLFRHVFHVPLPREILLGMIG
jgi:hypothetical protein